MAKFVTIGERLSTTAPAVNKAFTERDPEPILKRAKQQLDAGATYLDVNIGPAENDGPELMKWAVELLQSNFDNVPLALDTSNEQLSRLVFPFTIVQKENRSLTLQMLPEELSMLILQQQMTQSLSLFATAKESLKTMTSV